MKPCLALTPDGRKLQIPLSVARGVVATITKVEIVLQTELGKWTDDDSFGINYVRLGLMSDLEIEGIYRSQVAAVDGVIAVLSVLISRVSDSLSITIKASLQGDSGDLVVEFGVLAEAGQYPTTWYNNLGYDFAEFC